MGNQSRFYGRSRKIILKSREKELEKQFERENAEKWKQDDKKRSQALRNSRVVFSKVTADRRAADAQKAEEAADSGQRVRPAARRWHDQAQSLGQYH